MPTASDAEIVYLEASRPLAATSQSTIEALMYALRRGLSCFGEPGNVERLKCCDKAAVEQIAKRLRTWKAKQVPWLPPYTDNEIATLLKLWRALRERDAA